jgi:3-oxoadipate enol-lactonase
MRTIAGLEYDERGQGTAVLTIHGAIISDSFAPMMEEPALAGYRMIRYRRRGYGASPSVSAEPSMSEQTADALAMLKELGISRTHVVGHSAGGPIAIQIAVDAPELVQSLTLLEPAIQTAPMAADFHKMLTPLVEMHHAGQSAKAVHLFMRSAVSRDWRERTESVLPGAADRAEEDATGTFDSDLPWLRRWDFDTVVSRVTQPVLYITGSISAPKVEPATALARAALPTAEFVVIDGADHALQMTDPAAVARPIAQFLDRQPVQER